MGTQRYISTSFWDDEWIQTLDPSEKLLYLYLMTNPLTNIAGVYKITIRRISFDTGFNETVINFLFEKFKAAGKAYKLGEYVALPSWPKHQKWETKKAICDGIVSILNNLEDEIIEELAKINYKFDLSLTDHPPTIPPPSPHQPSYYDLNSNSDSNSDSDKDNDLEPPAEEKQTRPFFQVESTSKVFEETRKHWNSKGLPVYKHTLITCPGKDKEKILNSLSAYGFEDVKTAIDNYVEIITNPGKYEYDPKFQYRSFPNFMERGVGLFTDEVNPFDRCARNRKESGYQEPDRSIPDLTPEEEQEIAELKKRVALSGVL